MKNTIPAYYLEPQRNAAIPCVTVRPCLVTSLLRDLIPPHAVIELGSCVGTVTRTVPMSDLASTLGAAVKRAEAAIRALPLPSATAEKSASNKKAGAVAGASLANTVHQPTPAE